MDPSPPPSSEAGLPRSRGERKASSRALRAGRGVLNVLNALRANPLSFAGFILTVLLSAAAVVIWLDPAILPYPALAIFTGPLSQGPTWAHPFGTDELGRDIFSNVLAGLPTDLGIGVGIAGGALLFGGALGIAAGYYDRPRSLSAITSAAILRITDLFLAFPSLILALAITIALGRGVVQIVFAVFLTWWPYYVRLVRGEILAVKNQPYIVAARAAGVTERRIVLRHVLRNIMEPVIVYFTLDIGTVIVTFSTVAFVTGAIPYPTGPPVEWGAMITFYADVVNILPWTVLFPGLAIFVTVLAFSLLGDGLRDLLDPRSRRVMAQAAAAIPPPTLAAVPAGEASGGPSAREGL